MDTEESKKRGWFQLPISRLQMLIIGLVIGGAIVLTPLNLTARVEEYEYSNIRTQKDIVDKRVESVENRVSELKSRIDDTQSNVDTQLFILDKTTRKLERMMYQASPQVMDKLAKSEAEESELRVKQLKSINLNQTANPIINVNPTINNTGK